MIFNFRIFFAAITVFALTPLTFADDSQIVLKYAEHVSNSYSDTLKKAQALNTALHTLVKNPSEATQEAAKAAWMEARTAYSPTEVFRFYGGPIDSETGPEGLLNAWPLDEVYIDYVLGSPNSGIINDLLLYPSITKELLRDLNEKEGEKNISTGFHAIEFLLWGQDLNSNGPGKRKFTDFVVGTGKNADRRTQYLLIVSEMIVEDIQTLVAAWDLKDKSSYGAQFVAPTNTKESLKKILLAAYTLAAEELSQERMFVAYDTQQQEDEHSCFSDTTHMDIYYNYQGIQNVMNLFVNDLSSKNTQLQQNLSLQMATLENQTANFPAPFDQAILDPNKRPQILEIIQNLENLGEEILNLADIYQVQIKE
ncbi:MAG: iron-regulated protein [Bdellovibrionaceae bacterium]|nr:iron-regulated protein [Pseudobdellovibrionaceae bacterium]